MISQLHKSDFNEILGVINDAAQAYKGVIPADRWKEPYMSTEELKKEIENGVEFYGLREHGCLLGVMGIQKFNAVTLMRHAYVLACHQRKGIGEKLLNHLLMMAPTREILVGTWETACWAIRFYEKYKFRLVSKAEKNKLLRRYWSIPERQVETSVVLKLNKRGKTQSG